jgi:transcriptional regulator with XRE-family HTH domain
MPETSTIAIGARLRAVRQQRGMTIAGLAAAAGLTSGFLSQLERDQTSVSLSSLARICEALGITIGSLTDRPALGRLIRRDERQRSVVGGESGEHFIISSPAERRFHAIETHIPPGGSAGEPPYTFPAESELVVCLSGTLELRVGETVYVLEEGDTFTYSPRDAHTWRNPSDTDEAHVIWFSVPNPY